MSDMFFGFVLFLHLSVTCIQVSLTKSFVIKDLLSEINVFLVIPLFLGLQLTFQPRRGERDTANCLDWQRGHEKWSGPDHLDKVVGFTNLSDIILLHSYLFVL